MTPVVARSIGRRQSETATEGEIFATSQEHITNVFNIADRIGRGFVLPTRGQPKLQLGNVSEPRLAKPQKNRRADRRSVDDRDWPLVQSDGLGPPGHFGPDRRKPGSAGDESDWMVVNEQVTIPTESIDEVARRCNAVW